MASVVLPPEILVLIAKSLKFSSYEGFCTYLNFRNVSRHLHILLKVPTYTELLLHKDVFLSRSLLPCDTCLQLRPSSTHFFDSLRADGIGPYHVLGEGCTCIDCGVKGGSYVVGERFSLNGHGHFCVCFCCRGLGRSSIHMQVCSPCLDYDWSSPQGRSNCHRKGQCDRLSDLLQPASALISKPDLYLPDI